MQYSEMCKVDFCIWQQKMICVKINQCNLQMTVIPSLCKDQLERYSFTGDLGLCKFLPPKKQHLCFLRDQTNDNYIHEMMSQCQISHWGQVIKFFTAVNCCCCNHLWHQIFKLNEKEEMGPLFSLVLCRVDTGNLIP